MLFEKGEIIVLGPHSFFFGYVIIKGKLVFVRRKYATI